MMNSTRCVGLILSKRRQLQSCSFWRHPYNFFSTDSSPSNNVPKRQKRRLDVAIVGAPNAGKSQLLNVLTGTTVAAVSRKRHTTRGGILGARTIRDTQLLFVDTPGFMTVSNARAEGLPRDLSATATSEVQSVDYTLLVVDAARKLTDPLRESLVQLMLFAIHRCGGRDEGEYTLEESTARAPQQPESLEKFAIVLNKVDLVNPKTLLLDISEELGNMAEECIKYRDKDEEAPPEPMDPKLVEEMFPPIFYVSALKEDGVNDIVKHLFQKATPSESWAVPSGQATDLTPVERVAEVLREKIYRCLHKEIPHNVHQVNRAFRDTKIERKRVILIDQELVVKTKSHKRLVMGSGNRTLNRIQETAQRDLERMFECKVVLRLFVKLSKSQHQQQYESDSTGIFTVPHGVRVD